MNLVVNTISQYVKDACDACGNSGIRVRGEMKLHGIRGTAITQMFEAAFAPESVVLRISHPDSESLKEYHNLRGSPDRGRKQRCWVEEVRRLKNAGEMSSRGARKGLVKRCIKLIPSPLIT